MEFTSTNLPHNISHGLYHEKGYDVAETHIDKLFYVIMFGTANLLKDTKSKDAPTAFILTNIKNKPVAAAIVEYFDNGDNPGNWSLSWTFDPEKIPENAVKINLQDDNNVFLNTRINEFKVYQFCMGIVFEHYMCPIYQIETGLQITTNNGLLQAQKAVTSKKKQISKK